jgi:mRNA interferase RelE/StbE
LKVYLSSRAKKALDDSSTDLRERLESSIAELTQSPYPQGCKKLKGAPSSYRLRVGDYRILYSIIDSNTVLVFKISSRGSAYE